MNGWMKSHGSGRIAVLVLLAVRGDTIGCAW